MSHRSPRCWTLLLLAATAATADARGDVTLEHAWTHHAGGPGRAEIVAYHEATRQFLVVNPDQRCVMRLDALTGREHSRSDLSAWGVPTSVAASRQWVAVAIVAPRSTDPGHVVLLRSTTGRGNDEFRMTNDEQPQNPSFAVRVGAMPDMVTFTPDGRYVLVANEGEPSDDYRVDPEGSISVIDVGRDAERAVALTADFVAFNSQRDELERRGVRITAASPRAGDGRATLAQDLEPEYIAVAPDSRTAWVTLQENNALAVVDIPTARVTQIIGLGFKDHRRRASGLDASDADGGVQIRRWNVWGMYQPDGIASFIADGATYLATANEGEARRYTGFTDEVRVAELPLEPALTRDDPDLLTDARLGRLKVSRVGGDTDGDGDVDRLLAFGGRSLAIWSADGELVYDSGDALEQFVAAHLPERFNVSADGLGAVDAWSPERGPEPEGVVVGRVGASTYAFVGLERASAVAVLDVTRPHSARLLRVVPLDFGDNSPATQAGGANLGPEGLAFVPADRSPLGEPLLAVACEASGTTILLRVRPSQ